MSDVLGCIADAFCFSFSFSLLRVAKESQIMAQAMTLESEKMCKRADAQARLEQSLMPDGPGKLPPSFEA